MKSIFKNTVLFIVIFASGCQAQNDRLMLGIEQMEQYNPLLSEKNIGIVANASSVIANRKGVYTHLVDSLLSKGISVKAVFAPEHGFRGTAANGDIIADEFDEKSNLPIYSLHGKDFKPSSDQLKDIDIMLFDLQDVGLRFYTYISTLHYVMEACAEQGIPLIILDRPNPNGFYVDGPILDSAHQSFVGMHPVPIVYGMTIGEYAQMINGQKWLKDGITCNITVVPLKNYTHQTRYTLPLRPSPNLRTPKSINLYPSLCLFEGTDISVGRGTNQPFEIFGSPSLSKSNFGFSFTPISQQGATNPPHLGKLCFGKDLSQTADLSMIRLDWLVETYQDYKQQELPFFNNYFDKLAGNSNLRSAIERGDSVQSIYDSWKEGLDQFKVIRSKYLIYD